MQKTLNNDGISTNKITLSSALHTKWRITSDNVCSDLTCMLKFVNDFHLQKCNCNTSTSFAEKLTNFADKIFSCPLYGVRRFRIAEFILGLNWWHAKIIRSCHETSLCKLKGAPKDHVFHFSHIMFYVLVIFSSACLWLFLFYLTYFNWHSRQNEAFCDLAAVTLFNMNLRTFLIFTLFFYS